MPTGNDLQWGVHSPIKLHTPPEAAKRGGIVEHEDVRDAVGVPCRSCGSPLRYKQQHIFSETSGLPGGRGPACSGKLLV